MVDWSRIRVTRSDDTSAAAEDRRRKRRQSRGAGWSDAARMRWQAWRGARAERDVLGAYRADYSDGARFRWWQRLRAGVGLLFVVVLLGAGLTMMVGLFFIGFTIVLETLV